MKKIAKMIANRSSSSYPLVLKQMFQKLSINLHRSNARSILARLPATRDHYLNNSNKNLLLDAENVEDSSGSQLTNVQGIIYSDSRYEIEEIGPIINNAVSLVDSHERTASIESSTPVSSTLAEIISMAKTTDPNLSACENDALVQQCDNSSIYSLNADAAEFVPSSWSHTVPSLVSDDISKASMQSNYFENSGFIPIAFRVAERQKKSQVNLAFKGGNVVDLLPLSDCSSMIYNSPISSRVAGRKLRSKLCNRKISENNANVDMTGISLSVNSQSTG